jgi:hypothetical protein
LSNNSLFDWETLLDRERIEKAQDKTYMSYLRAVIEHNIRVYSTYKKTNILFQGESEALIFELQKILPIIEKL